METNKIVLGYALLVTRSKGCKIIKAGFAKDWANVFSSLFIGGEDGEGRGFLIKIKFESLNLTRDVSEASVCHIHLREPFQGYHRYEDTICDSIISNSKILEGRNPVQSRLIRDEHGDGGDWKMDFVEMRDGTQILFNERFPLPRRHVPNKTRAAVYAKFGGRCAYCGKPIKIDEMQVDHILSHSKGGKDELDNFLPSCPLCNRSKGAMDLELFRKYIEDDAPRIHFKKNRKWYADADKIVDAYGLQPKDNKVVFFFEKKGIKI